MNHDLYYLLTMPIGYRLIKAASMDRYYYDEYYWDHLEFFKEWRKEHETI